MSVIYPAQVFGQLLAVRLAWRLVAFFLRLLGRRLGLQLLKLRLQAGFVLSHRLLEQAPLFGVHGFGPGVELPRLQACQLACFGVRAAGHLVGDKGLTPQSVALVVKRSVKRVHGAAATKVVSGHSLRAGYCTEAALVGLAPWQIREQTGHKSDVTLAKYIRPITKRKIPSLL